MTVDLGPTRTASLGDGGLGEVGCTRRHCFAVAVAVAVAVLVPALASARVGGSVPVPVHVPAPVLGVVALGAVRTHSFASSPNAVRSANVSEEPVQGS